MTSRARPGLSRETRLLAATIGVSLLVLLTLARFRFPDAATPAGEAAAQPLARLAARAAFDDLSLAVRELSTRVTGSLLVLRTTPARGSDSPQVARNAADARRTVPALRVRDDVAVVLLQDGMQVEGLAGVPGRAPVIAHDEVRGLALVRVPTAAAPVLSMRDGLQPLTAPGYVVVAEGSPAGVALRPVFVGRSDEIADPGWDTPLLTVGRGAAGDIGAPVFMLDGRLAGLLTSSGGDPALLPADVLMRAVDQLLRGTVTATGDIGIVTQALDERLAAATGVTSGAAVAAVRPDGPAAATLLPGDVVTAVNGQPVGSPEALRISVVRARPGSVLTLTVRREGAFVTLPVTVRERVPGEARPGASAGRPGAPATLGLTLRAVPDVGSEVVRVQPGSAAEAAGLRPGDIVVRGGRTSAPAPADVTSAFARLDRGAVLFLSVERTGEPLLVALRR